MNPSWLGYVQARPDEVTQGPTITAASRNERPNEIVYPQRALEDIRQSDTPSRWARMPIATFTNVAGILSVMSDTFGGRLWAPQNIAGTTSSVGMHTNKVMPWRERSNIEKRPAVPYGSLFELSADDKYTYLFGK